MTEIKIMRLTLENFKCHRALTLEFNGRNASIYGDNASGKTSIYDALTWLLFGKDSAGNGEKNTEIKPLGPDGEVLDHNALTSVEAVLSVNGEGITLKRTYKEVWSTKRGSSQASYDGNTSEYFIDGVPMKAGTFKDAVRSLVEEETFLMLTSVDAFASRMDWKKRREALFRLAGIEDDRMIMCTNERFLPLIEAMGRSDLDGLKRKLAADKKGLSVTKNELPARLSECEGIVASISGLDFESARVQKQELEQEGDRLNGQYLGLGQNAEIRELQVALKEATMERDRIVAENELYRKNQLSGTVDVVGLNIRMTALQNRLVIKQSALDAERKYVKLMDSKVAEFRQQWMGVNSLTFDGSEVCPTCGQALPALQLQVAKDAWAEDKQKRLERILHDADTAKANKAMSEDRFKALQEEIREIEEEIAGIRQQIADAQASRVEPKDMEGYGEALEAAKAKMDEISGKIFEAQNNIAGVRQRLQAELNEIRSKIHELDEILSKESLLKYTEDRMEKLKADAQKAAEALDGIESLLFLIEEYSRYKTTFVEDTVNDMFRIARFRLYRNQANGGLEDRCDVVHEGVPYNSVNNGMKINLGIDIINTLSGAYGVRVPLFVDNAESVTNLEHCHSQRIRLVVSENDKELRVNYEDS